MLLRMLDFLLLVWQRNSLGIGTTTTHSLCFKWHIISSTEIARINFMFNDTYSFKLTDRDTGLSYQVGDSVAGMLQVI